jgi:transposase
MGLPRKFLQGRFTLESKLPTIQSSVCSKLLSIEVFHVIGTPARFHCGKQIASYVEMVATEESSGDRRRLGHISKQGNVLLRSLLVEVAQVMVRSHPEWRSTFFHLAMRRGRKIAKVAMARKLAVHLYWMWRQGLGTASCTSSVRTRESPEIAMECSKSPT